MSPPQHASILLYNDECAVCRRIAGWVRASSARSSRATTTIDVRPIGDDPEALALVHPQLDIWAAYATIHLVMPDGSMKVGGQAVAEVLRDLPNTRWFAGIFALDIAGFRPFQLVLDAGYTVLSEIRPLLGCASCGSRNAGIRSIQRSIAVLAAPFRGDRHAHRARHPRAATRRRPPKPQTQAQGTPTGERA